MRRMEGSHLMPPSAVIHHRISVRRPNKLSLWIKNFQFQAKKIDVFSRVFFPFVFAIFNVWYWSYYLTRKQGKPEKWVPRQDWVKALNTGKFSENNEKKQFNNMIIKLTNFEDSKTNLKQNVLHVTGNFCWLLTSDITTTTNNNSIKNGTNNTTTNSDNLEYNNHSQWLSNKQEEKTQMWPTSL